MSNPKLLIVGAFPFLRKNFKEDTFYGGILTSSKIILNSSLSKKYEIIPLDSTQNSTPPPNLLARSVFAIRRIFILIFKLTMNRPNAALIFASDGGSALEKGLMIWICNFFQCVTFIFPRAGNLINQTSNSSFMLKIIRLFYRSSTIFLCQGPKWKDYAINTLGINESKVKIVSNWTATKRQIQIGSDRSYEISNAIPKILFVGWLEDFKGVFELLNACKNLRNEGFEFHLTLAGKGDAEISAKKFVKNNKLEKYITFMGWVNSEGLENVLKNSNIFVLPSWSEGLPNAMIEAMAAGLAIVVTSVGTIPDFIDHNKHGIIIPPQKTKNLENALKILITDKNFRNELAKNAHNMAKKEFSSESSISKLIETIEEVI